MVKSTVGSIKYVLPYYVYSRLLIAKMDTEKKMVITVIFTFRY